MRFCVHNIQSYAFKCNFYVKAALEKIRHDAHRDNDEFNDCKFKILDLGINLTILHTLQAIVVVSVVLIAIDKIVINHGESNSTNIGLAESSK